MKLESVHIIHHPALSANDAYICRIIKAVGESCISGVTGISDSAEEYGGSSSGIFSVQPDMIIALGGDGTFLTAARQSAGMEVPILGIAAGNIGFLAECPPACIEEAIAGIREDKFVIIDRMMLFYSMSPLSGSALNDICLSRSGHGLARLEIRVNRELLDIMSGDGVILSSPTGSTAYSLSAGGPIVHPVIRSVLITPLAAHSLHSRPVMISDRDTIELKVIKSSASLNLVADGRDIAVLQEDEVIAVSAARHSARTIAFPGWNFFGVLRKKLKWGESVEAQSSPK